jgi:hypothetical protein
MFKFSIPRSHVRKIVPTRSNFLNLKRSNLTEKLQMNVESSKLDNFKLEYGSKAYIEKRLEELKLSSKIYLERKNKILLELGEKKNLLIEFMELDDKQKDCEASIEEKMQQLKQIRGKL